MRIAGTYMQFVEVIIVLNVLIFILSVTNPITNFTLVPAKVLERPWTILTSMFIHYNVWHLILNMFALFFLGSYLVGVIGEDKLIRIYFVGGIAGGLFFTCFAFLWGLLGISGLWGLLAHLEQYSRSGGL
jgi:membrane associated rhomboid family serine protease